MVYFWWQKLNQKEENNLSYYLFQKEKHHKSTIKYLKQLKNQLKRLIGSVIQLLSLTDSGHGSSVSQLFPLLPLTCLVGVQNT